MQHLQKVKRIGAEPTGRPLLILDNNDANNTFAASSATEAEEQQAKLGKMQDGTKPAHVPQRVWQPQVKNTHVEPDVHISESDTLEWAYEDMGRTMLKDKEPLPPHTDIIKFNPTQHNDKHVKNIQWRDCPTTWQPVIEAIIKEKWDCFTKDGMQNHMRGYELSIDVGNVKPACCKTPRYGPHESRVMRELIQKLEDKLLIEDDHGPWGAQAALAAKPNQGHMHWTQHVFRPCVSYRNINAVTRPFAFPINQCDDAVDNAGVAKFFITLDLDAGYWQVKMHQDSKDKTAFFTPDGKKHWNVMPMGMLNAAAFFVCMTGQFKQEWDIMCKRDPASFIDGLLKTLKKWKPIIKEIDETEIIERTLKQRGDAIREQDPDSAVIVDDLMLYDSNIISLLACFMAVLTVLEECRVTVNLRKGRFLPARAEFVGTDVLATGNSPAKSKCGPIEKLQPPKTYSDLRMLIGLPGFYAKWIPHCETLIKPWRDKLTTQPAPGSSPKLEEESDLRAKWTKTHDETLTKVKKAIIDGPVLKRPNSK